MITLITFVDSSQKLGLTSGVSLILLWAIFLGATAQLIACINNFKHDNTFGAYAMFWYDVGFNWLIQNGVFSPELAATIDVK